MEGTRKTTCSSTEIDGGWTRGEEEIEDRGDVRFESFRGREEVGWRIRSEGAVEILGKGKRSKRRNGRRATDLG